VKFDIPHLSLGSLFDLSLLECKLPLSELVKAAPRSLFQKYHLQNNPLVADITNVISKFSYLFINVTGYGPLNFLVTKLGFICPAM
jgi:hypothetical protein